MSTCTNFWPHTVHVCQWRYRSLKRQGKRKCNVIIGLFFLARIIVEITVVLYSGITGHSQCKGIEYVIMYIVTWGTMTDETPTCFCAVSTTFSGDR